LRHRKCWGETERCCQEEVRFETRRCVKIRKVQNAFAAGGAGELVAALRQTPELDFRRGMGRGNGKG